MTSQRKTRTQAQALPLNRRKAGPALRVVPRNVVAAGQSVAEMRSDFLRYVDFHPALYMLAGVAIIALVCVIYLTQVTAVINANYTVQTLVSEHTALLRERQDLQLQIARAQSLQNIETTAHNKLHMVPIGDKYEYLSIPAGPVQSSKLLQDQLVPGASDLQP